MNKTEQQLPRVDIFTQEELQSNPALIALAAKYHLGSLLALMWAASVFQDAGVTLWSETPPELVPYSRRTTWNGFTVTSTTQLRWAYRVFKRIRVDPSEFPQRRHHYRSPPGAGRPKKSTLNPQKETT